jgi:hypothetical protein
MPQVEVFCQCQVSALVLYEWIKKTHSLPSHYKTVDKLCLGVSNITLTSCNLYFLKNDANSMKNSQVTDNFGIFSWPFFFFFFSP